MNYLKSFVFLRVVHLGIDVWKLYVDGKWHLTLNKTVRPIANKYCEGKLKQNFEKRVKKKNVKLIRVNRKREAKRNGDGKCVKNISFLNERRTTCVDDF